MNDIESVTGVSGAIMDELAKTIVALKETVSGLVASLSATALHLAAEQFLTFDAHKKHLAEAKGITIPP
jgi:hypothetical protein